MRRLALAIVTLLALAAAALGLARLRAPLEGLAVAPLAVGEIPATV